MTRTLLRVAIPLLGLSTAVLAIALTQSGCNDNKTETRDNVDYSTKSDSSNGLERAADTIGTRMENAADKVADIFSNNRNPDSAFLADAASSNLAELQLLQQGPVKGADPNLKADAKHMITDHNALGKKVKDYAAGKKYPIPHDAEGKADKHLRDLEEEKAGMDWDRKWAGIMVDEHQKAIRDFEKAQDKVNDPALKNMISNALPTLRHHLEMIEALKDRLSK